MAVTVFLPQASAYPLIFATGPTTVNGSAVNAESTFTFNVTNQTITIQLLNLQLNPGDVAQLISGVEFDLTHLGSGSLSGTSINSGLTTESSLDVNGSGTPIADQHSSSWIVQNTGISSLTLCTICSGGGQPDELIIGGPDLTTGTYTAAMGSIAGNGPHNPFIMGSGGTYSSGTLHTLQYTSPTWVLNLPGNTLLPATSISHVNFLFGTTYGAVEDSVSSFSAPEPGAMVMILSGLLLIAVARVSCRWHKP
jgi:hypothetical protein